MALAFAEAPEMPEKPRTFRLDGYRDAAERSRAVTRARGSAAARGYDAAWRRLRLAVLAEEPLCRFCKAEGKVTPATVVDHIDGNAWNRARLNLRPLCKPCHDRRTARDQAFGR